MRDELWSFDRHCTSLKASDSGQSRLGESVRRGTPQSTFLGVSERSACHGRQPHVTHNFPESWFDTTPINFQDLDVRGTIRLEATSSARSSWRTTPYDRGGSLRCGIEEARHSRAKPARARALAGNPGRTASAGMTANQCDRNVNSVAIQVRRVQRGLGKLLCVCLEAERQSLLPHFPRR